MKPLRAPALVPSLCSRLALPDFGRRRLERKTFSSRSFLFLNEESGNELFFHELGHLPLSPLAYPKHFYKYTNNL